MVTPPPVGAVVPELPPGAEAIPAGNGVYYYAGGAFYLPVAGGFQVVAPPLGVTIPELPPGATPVTISGVPYYQADGVFYEPIMENGVTVYETVPPPPP
ncbi:conserved hypothetical protein [Verrucomicrobia bacterium]|nr:conserved hypothetical protein [Verrucomicrobiota bacterium]